MRVEFGAPPLTQEMVLKDVTLPVGSVLVYRDKNSSDLDSVIFAKIPLGVTAKARGLVFGPGRISFSKFGFKDGGLAYPQVFNGIKIKENILFNQYTNNLETIFLAEDSLVRGLMLRGGSAVQFYQSGELMEVQLAEEITVNNLVIPTSHIVAFNEDGTIQSIRDDKHQPWDGFTPKM